MTRAELIRAGRAALAHTDAPHLTPACRHGTHACVELTRCTVTRVPVPCTCHCHRRKP